MDADSGLVHTVVGTADISPSAVQHPLNTETIGQFSVVIAPGLDAQGGRDRPVGTQGLEESVRGIPVVHHEQVRGAPQLPMPMSITRHEPLRGF